MNKSALITAFLVNASFMFAAGTGNNAVIKIDTGFASHAPIPEKKRTFILYKEALPVNRIRVKPAPEVKRYP